MTDTFCGVPIRILTFRRHDWLDASEVAELQASDPATLEGNATHVYMWIIARRRYVSALREFMQTHPTEVRAVREEFTTQLV